MGALGGAADSATNEKPRVDGSAQSTGCLRPGRTRIGAAISLRNLPQMASLSRDVAQKRLLEKVVRSAVSSVWPQRRTYGRAVAPWQLFQFPVRAHLHLEERFCASRRRRWRSSGLAARPSDAPAPCDWHPSQPMRARERWAARCAVELGARPLAGLCGEHHQHQSNAA